ncbi:helix-turn-helix transcriptional regulator [Paraburkholderia aspalathi]|nr:helix-turn-helix transcriptional regulator [Paraburkholderia aspalathi]MBK3780165.1 helix-turn-helix transcriptional regulator [Paraburkholderia aspalathi]
MTIEQKLATARKEANLTVEQAAARAGLSVSMWRRLEKGQGRFSFEEIRQAARAMNLRISIETRAPDGF